MRKISAMYQWSGGTSYGHKCGECTNCKKLSDRTYKCKIYGETDGHETDWKPCWTACKAYNEVFCGEPVIVSGTKRKTVKIGQLSLFDFMAIGG